MKTYNEMADDVLRRIGEYKSAQKKRRKTAVRISAIVCCGAIAVLAGAGIQKGGFFSVKTDSSGAENNHSGLISAPAESSESTESEKQQTTASAADNSQKPPRSWELYGNKITAQANAAKLHFDPALYYEKKCSSEQMAEYFGRDFTRIDGLEYTGRYENFKIIFANNGKIAYDTSSFTYNNRSVTVLVSKIGTPYDCNYMLESNNVSNFKTKSGALVGVLAGTDGKGFYLADFEYNGINYRITAENSDDSEFVKVIENVIG